MKHGKYWQDQNTLELLLDVVDQWRSSILSRTSTGLLCTLTLMNNRYDIMVKVSKVAFNKDVSRKHALHKSNAMRYVISYQCHSQS